MRFVAMTECRTPHGTTHHRRWWDAIEEAAFAEEMGFDVWGTSEHHFFVDLATVSTPEVLYAAVEMRTSRITLRPMSILLPVHHPVTVAERLAALDILSNGRIELCTARGNTLLQLDGFGVPLDETQARHDEALEIILKALSNDTFQHDGEYWKIPLRSLTPRPLQHPHLPVHKVTASPNSARLAAQGGLGALASDGYMGWEYLQSVADAYLDGLKDPKPVVQVPTNALCASVISGVCADTTEEAIRIGEDAAVHFAKRQIGDYPTLAARADDYAYTQKMAELKAHAGDIHFLNGTPSVMLGDPDHWITQIERYREMGFTEVKITFDGFDHREILRNLEMVGRHVIPHFKTPHSVVQHGPITGADEFQYTKA